MFNWIIFGILIILVYLSDILIAKIFIKKDPVVTKIDSRKEELKNKLVKTIEEQKEYLNLIREKENMFGNWVAKFVFIICMMIVFSIALDYLVFVWIKIIFTILYSFIIPLLYVSFEKNKKYSMYNYFSMMNMFVFFCGFMVIQNIEPLMFMNFKIQLLYMLPAFFLLKGIINVISGKKFLN